MHTNYFAYESADAAMQGKKAQSTNYMTLNGTWKFSWVRNADQRPTDFWKVGFNDKGWNNLQVPAVWELNGYGDPIYVNTGYAWRNQFQNNPPEVPTENNHVGSYRREIIDSRRLERERHYRSFRFCNLQHVSLGKWPLCRL